MNISNATKLFALSCFGGLLPESLLAEGRRPNILIFMVDDMGWQDTSVPFSGDTTAYNRLFRTPAMASLAESGIVLTDAYAHSVSSPSRCSLLTGLHPARHKVTNWTLKRDTPTDEPHSLLDPPLWNVNGLSAVAGIPNTYVTQMLPEWLRAQGYRTIHCGKAHWGAESTPGENPLSLGFDVNIAGHAAGGLATYLGQKRYGHDAEGNPTSPFAIPDLQDYWDTDTFATEALTQRALGALRQHRAEYAEQPFFLFMSHYAVHVPIEPDPRYYQRYIDQGLDPKDAAYASLVEGMDKSLGDLMSYLQEEDILDNTFVLFLSDNGGLAASSYWRAGALHTQNAPLKSGKGSLHEGGVRVPMIVRLPEGQSQGLRLSTPVQIEDVFPTLVELVGGKDVQPKASEWDGESLMPLLREGAPLTPRPQVWHYPHRWGLDGPGIDFASAIRLGEWKLVHHYATGKQELYNLSVDLSEQNDLSTELSDKRRELANLLTEKLKAMQAQRPSFKATGELAPWPDATM